MRCSFNFSTVSARRRMLSAAGALAALAVATSATAQVQPRQADPFVIREQFGGAANAVLIESGVAYVGVGPRVGAFWSAERGHAAALEGGVYVFERGRTTPTEQVAPAPTRTPTLQVPSPTTGPVRSTAYLPLTLSQTADKPRQVAPIRHYPLQPGKLAAHGDDRVVRIEGRHLVTYDIRSPAAMREIGRSSWTDSWTDIDIRGDTAVVVGTSGTLGVWDVADEVPVQVGSLNLPDLAGGVTFIDGGAEMVLVAAGEGGLMTVDISDSSSPRAVGALSIASGAAGVATHGNLAAVWGRSWKQPAFLVDVSDPIRPVLLSRLAEPPLNVGGPTDLNDKLAVATTCGNCLSVFDISDPKGPVVTGESPILDVGDPLLVDNILYGFGHGALTVTDLTNPSAPERLDASLALSGGVIDLTETARLLVASTRHLFNSYGDEEDDEQPFDVDMGTLLAYDKASPGEAAVGAYMGVVAEGFEPITTAAAIGSRAAHKPETVAADYALSQVVATWSTPFLAPGEPYLPCHPDEFGTVWGAQLIRLDRLPDLESQGFVPLLCEARRFVTEGNRAYALISDEGNLRLRVVEFDAEGTGNLVNDVALPSLWHEEASESFVVKDGIVMMAAAASYRGTVLVDTRLGEMEPNVVVRDQRVSAIAIEGATAFIATWDPYTILTMDISDPKSPQLLGSLDLTAQSRVPEPERPPIVTQLAARANVLYYGGPVGLEAVDVSNPRQPAWLGVVGPPGAVASLSGPELAVQYGARLSILDISEPRQPIVSYGLDVLDSDSTWIRRVSKAGDYWIANGKWGYYVFQAEK